MNDTTRDYIDFVRELVDVLGDRDWHRRQWVENELEPNATEDLFLTIANRLVELADYGLIGRTTDDRQTTTWVRLTTLGAQWAAWPDWVHPEAPWNQGKTPR